MTARIIENVDASLGQQCLVFNYPFGFKPRCVMSWCIETATSGAKKDMQRAVSRTTAKSFNLAYTARINEDGVEAANAWAKEQIEAGRVPWNKPKGSVYSLLVALALDENDHVQVHHLSWAEAARVHQFMKFGDKLSRWQLDKLTRIAHASRNAYPDEWAKLDGQLAAEPA